MIAILFLCAYFNQQLFSVLEKIKCARADRDYICGESGQSFFHKTTTCPNESADGNVISNECLSMSCFSASAQNLQCEDHGFHCRCQLDILSSRGNDLETMSNAPNVKDILISILSKVFVYTFSLN